jgi:translation initiation factor 3 subunit L
MVHIAESTIGRRYAGWFIKNGERAQRVLDDIKNAPLPAAPVASSAPTGQGEATKQGPATQQGQKGVSRAQGQGAPKVAWGGAKIA